MGLFSTPIEQSSIDPQYRSLDGYRWSEVLDRWDYRSPALRRYLDYCCRDDFGVVASEVSAWAGVHYFAGRRGVGANCPDGALLSWPAGNGHLVEQFERRLLPHLCTGQLVRFIQKQSPWRIRVQDVNDLTQERWHENPSRPPDLGSTSLRGFTGPAGLETRILRHVSPAALVGREFGARFVAPRAGSATELGQCARSGALAGLRSGEITKQSSERKIIPPF